MNEVPQEFLQLAWKQGWQTDTLMNLAFEFLNDSDATEAFYGYCLVRARDEREA